MDNQRSWLVSLTAALQKGVSGLLAAETFKKQENVGQCSAEARYFLSNLKPILS